MYYNLKEAMSLDIDARKGDLPVFLSVLFMYYSSKYKAKSSKTYWGGGGGKTFKEEHFLFQI